MKNVFIKSKEHNGIIDCQSQWLSLNLEFVCSIFDVCIKSKEHNGITGGEGEYMHTLRRPSQWLSEMRGIKL